VRSSQASAEHWVAVNGAGPASTRAALPDADPDDGSTLERVVWGEGSAGEVVLVEVHGGGHAIPGGVAMGSPWLTMKWLGATNRDAQGADLIWDFFQHHRRRPEAE
jgi:polyhydroxybutyrate depolymerase